MHAINTIDKVLRIHYLCRIFFNANGIAFLQYLLHCRLTVGLIFLVFLRYFVILGFHITQLGKYRRTWVIICFGLSRKESISETNAQNFTYINYVIYKCFYQQQVLFFTNNTRDINILTYVLWLFFIICKKVLILQFILSK